MKAPPNIRVGRLRLYGHPSARNLDKVGSNKAGFSYSIMTSLLLYSKISPGWQSKALQIASRVEKRIALAFPFFKMEMFDIVIPIFSESSVTLIFLLASITSTFTMIGMFQSPQIVKSFSDFRAMASCKSRLRTEANTKITNATPAIAMPMTTKPGASSFSANT